MFRICYPMTSSKQIERGSRQKRLEIQLLQPKIARSSYLTRSYTLSNGSFNPRSCCIQGTELRSFLTLTRLLECGIALFIWAQNKDFRRGLGALRMKCTRSTDSKRKPHTQTRLSMSIWDMPPISTVLSCWTQHTFCFPINEKVAVIEAFRFFCCP